MENSKNTESWSRIQAQSLITEFKKYPCLYNPVDINFLNKSVRSEKLKTILNVLKTIKPLITVDEVKRKIKSLKGQLFKERQKIINSKRSGSGTDDVYKPTLWCYDQLSFLININDAEPSKSTIDCSQKKRKSKGQTMEMCGIEAVQFMKNYFANNQKKKQKEVVQREEEFCRYLCSLLKKIKIEENFEKLTFQIIILVNEKIDEERNWLQKNNYVSPISTSTSSLPSYSTTNSSSSRDSLSIPSPLPYQYSNSPQTTEDILNFEPISTSIPIDSTSTPLKRIQELSTNLRNKQSNITSRSQTSNFTSRNYVNTPSPPTHTFITDPSTYLDAPNSFPTRPVTSPFNPSRSFSSTPTHSIKSGSLHYKRSKPLFILSRSQTSDSTSKYNVNNPSSHLGNF